MCFRSIEWNRISGVEKSSLGLTFECDGEFWMSYKDFTRHFTHVVICNINPESLHMDEGRRRRWNMSVFEGSWRKGVTAGGGRNYLGKVN